MANLYIECGMGAAGDMLCAALYELLTDEQKEQYIIEMNASGIPGVSIQAHSSVKCGITGTHMKVLIGGVEEGHHDHEHHHNHEHHHASLHDVHNIIENTNFSQNVKRNACRVYDMIAQAESKAHGREVSEIHFHEVGMMDAIADVLGACRLVEMIDPDKIMASPVCVGFGTVNCAHGVMPVPAPATAHILEGVPVYSGENRGEMCTPTGAAILKCFVDEFANMPPMIVSGTGYGMGKKDFAQANCVRVFKGEMTGTVNQIPNDYIIELNCNIDDMTGEEIGFATDVLREAGALEVFSTPVQMKKNRPGVLISVLCKEEDEEKMVGLILKHTTTWGVRKYIAHRHVMERHFETVDTKYGKVNVKYGKGYGVEKSKVEYEDAAALAIKHNVSIDDIIRSID